MNIVMKNLSILAFAAAASLALTGCFGSSNNNGSHMAANTKIGLWAVTNIKTGTSFTQQDRLANPVVNEVFATYANDRHKVNNQAQPSEDHGQLANDIQSFMTGTAGRSQATTNVVKAVLVPDIMIADLSVSGPGSYLGTQTGGATGSKGGGRELRDDVVDISLGVVFGNTVSALGLAADDGKE
ncbi:MAG: DUF4331 family protein, partial [Armatimonadota bacterium]